MRCPNCSAECPEQASKCEFCGQPFKTNAEKTATPIEQQTWASPPELPNYLPPPIPQSSGFESDNPYAASDSSSYGSPQIPHYDVPNHLALSITSAVLSLFCCCIPFGIVPVIFAAQVGTKLANGDFEGAQSSSANAKLWSWICIGVALGIFALNMILQFATIGLSGLFEMR